MTRPNEVAAVRAGGWALVLAAILFIAVFSYLAATFDYPGVLDRPAAAQPEGRLPKFLADALRLESGFADEERPQQFQ